MLPASMLREEKILFSMPKGISQPKALTDMTRDLSPWLIGLGLQLQPKSAHIFTMALHV